MLAALSEGKLRSEHQVAYGAGRKDLSGVGARRDVHRVAEESWRITRRDSIGRPRSGKLAALCMNERAKSGKTLLGSG